MGVKLTPIVPCFFPSFFLLVDKLFQPAVVKRETETCAKHEGTVACPELFSIFPISKEEDKATNQQTHSIGPRCKGTKGKHGPKNHRRRHFVDRSVDKPRTTKGETSLTEKEREQSKKEKDKPEEKEKHRASKAHVQGRYAHLFVLSIISFLLFGWGKGPVGLCFFFCSLPLNSHVVLIYTFLALALGKRNGTVVCAHY